MKKFRTWAMVFIAIALILAGLPLASTAANHPDDSGWLEPQAPPAPDGIIVRAISGANLESLGLESQGAVTYHNGVELGNVWWELPDSLKFAVVRPGAGKAVNVETISSLAGVGQVEENGHYGLAGRMPLDPYFREERMWGWEAMDAPNAYPAGLVTNLVMATIDTGCPTQGHEDWPAIPWQDQWYIKDGAVYQGNAEDRETEGHGTHVGGIMWAKGDNGRGAAGLLSQSGRKVCIKAFHSIWATAEDVAMSFFVARLEGVQVVNGSFGGSESDIVSDAIRFYLSAGDTWAVFACGNSGSQYQTCSHPASLANSSEEFERVISVGALEAPGVPASYSNRGAVLWAPGSGICSTTSWGDYACWSGTSMASPHVAALVAAVLYDHPEYGGDEMLTHFVNCSVFVVGAGYAPMATCGGVDESVWGELFLPFVGNGGPTPTPTVTSVSPLPPTVNPYAPTNTGGQPVNYQSGIMGAGSKGPAPLF